MATTAELFEVSPGGSSESGRPGVRAARWAGGGADTAQRGKVRKARGGVAAPVAARAEREMGEGWLGDPGGEVGREGNVESERRRVGFVRRAGGESRSFRGWKMYSG